MTWSRSAFVSALMLMSTRGFVNSLPRDQPILTVLASEKRFAQDPLATLLGFDGHYSELDASVSSLFPSFICVIRKPVKDLLNPRSGGAGGT